MNLSTVISVLTTSTATIATVLISSNQVLSQQPTFICGTSKDGFPATIVQSPKHGDVALITWNSSFFKDGGFDDQKRCNIVTQKFQNYSDQDTLKFFTAGTVNRQPAICAVPYDGASCTNDTLLFTLKPGSNAEETIQRLFDLKRGASDEGLYENNNVSAADRTYISFEEVLENKAKEANETTQEATSNEQQNPTDNMEYEPLF